MPNQTPCRRQHDPNQHGHKWPSLNPRRLRSRCLRFLQNPFILGLLALSWLVLRSGANPRRLAYPCQRAAMSAAAIALGAPLTGALIASRRGLGALFRRPAALAILAAAGFLAASLPAYAPQVGTYLNQAFSGQAWFEAGGRAQYFGAHLEAPASYRANLYRVTNSHFKPTGNRFIGLDNLIALMGRQGLKFYQSDTELLAAGPDGIIASDDVVVIKINYQWTQRGGTNVDLLAGLIQRIVDHPDGFTGEIVVCENGQFVALEGFDRADNNNAQNHARSPHDVVVAFQGLGYSVSDYDWTLVRGDSVAEYSDGDLTDGYVLYDYDPDVNGRVSYPKFRTASGTYISLKHGIWDPVAETYDRAHLKFINVPVLKSHHAVYGATASVKHYMGVVTDLLGTSSHNAVATGLMGTHIAEIGLADLNIIDAVYINANPNSGPATAYTGATRWKELVACADPVAADIWSVKNILVPAFVAGGYSPPWPEPSADPDDSTSTFRNYLDNSMYELLAAGDTVTNDLSKIDAFSGNGRAGDFDEDADIDSLDFTQFVGCYTGSGGGPVGPECAAADFDSDGDVDCYDWLSFEFVWTGPGDLPTFTTCTAGVEDLPENGVGAQAWLGEAFPNPTAGASAVRFSLARPGEVRVKIFDAAGRQVRTLVDAAMPAGEHSAVWDGKNHDGRAAAGVYFYRLDAPGFSSTKKVTISR